MSQELRRWFNANWTPEKYQQFLTSLDADLGIHVEFRISETPCFFAQSLADSMCAAGVELLRQAVGNPVYRQISERAIPPQYRVPREAAQPMFVQCDFGVVRGPDGHLHPKLVEIQGFPSLYAFQPLMAEHYRGAYGLPANLGYLLGGLDRSGYNALLRQAIVGEQNPENVILLEIDPDHQKTRCDFVATERITGIRTVCITKLTKQGNKLFYDRDGVLVPVHRIYDRAIVDELERKQARIPFAWTDDLDVEWAGHPNWYFRLSKLTIPYLKHESVPETHFLDQIPSIPEDLDNWVLKPLFSFAGLGVIVGPTRADLDAVTDRANYILQRRVRWEPVIETPHGMTMAEIRLMFVWLDGGEPLPVNTIIRTGRGKMMGVDHNKGMSWVGASAAFYT